MLDEEIKGHVKQIQKAMDDGDLKLAATVLQHFDKFQPTTESLKRTSVGVFLNSLKKHKNCDDEIRAITKGYITKWKGIVSKETNGANGGGQRVVATKTSVVVKKETSAAGETTTTVTETKTTAVLERKPSAPRVTVPTDRKNSTGVVSPQSATTPVARERSFKLDRVTLKGSGDKMRDKSVELMYAAVGLGSDDESSHILKCAQSIEEALYNEYAGITPTYKSQFRILVANFKNNAGVRRSLLDGALEPSAVVTMTAEDLMSDDAKRAAEEAAKKNLMDSMTAPPQDAETDAFRCGKCGQRKTRYYQKQTRSADEPMTTFVTCVVCGNKWKFC
ncbi:RNA polymerase II elongation factor [Irineochytrium annulatum]|nr:RNA polymerase II elongation factor [Irineochytrium annulatum]